ncbi:MAG: hypothetical protein WC863_02395 [Patescibacteria group bacterium]
MIKNNLAKSLVAFSVLALVSGTALSALAATDTSFSNLTAKSELSKNQDSKNIKNTRFKMGQNKLKGQKLTESEKTSLKAEAALRQQNQSVKRVAIDAALKNSDYQAWLKAVGSNSALTTKITADNFSKLVEAYKLRQQAAVIMKDLGIERMGFEGMGLGRMELRDSGINNK